MLILLDEVVLQEVEGWDMLSLKARLAKAFVLDRKTENTCWGCPILLAFI